MTIYFFDANAVVKYYILEPGSNWVRGIVDLNDQQGQSAHKIAIADISIAEVAAAFSVLHRTGRIRRKVWQQAFDLFTGDPGRRFSVSSTNRQGFVVAANLTQKHPLKAYDAVQLAVALRYNSVLQGLGLTLAFVSGDHALLTAATNEGLPNDNPFDHAVTQDTPTP